MFVQQRSNHMTKIQTSFVFKSRIFNGLSQCETVVMEPPWTSHIAKERSHFESSRPSDGNCTLLGVDNETNFFNSQWEKGSRSVSRGLNDLKGHLPTNKWSKTQDHQTTFRGERYFYRVHCDKIWRRVQLGEQIQTSHHKRLESFFIKFWQILTKWAQTQSCFEVRGESVK